MSLLKTAAAVALSLSAHRARAQDSSPSGPTMPNIASNCNAYHTVVSGDGCWSITQLYDITLAEFYAWNPDVTDDCSTNFWLGYSYCVGIGAATPSTTSSSSRSGTSSSTKSTASTSSHSITSTTSSSATVPSQPPSSTFVSNTEPYSTRYPITNLTIAPTSISDAFPPQRTQPGQPATCNDWYLVSAADTCDTIVSSSSWLTKANLLAWNPALGSDCAGLYDGWWVCISVKVASVDISIGYTTTDAPADVPTLTGSYTPTTYPTVNTSFTASPTQAGLVSGCKAFFQAQSGDTCRDFVNNYLTQQDFFAWNPSLNGNCDGLWAGYYYCVVGPNGAPEVLPPTVTVAPSVKPPGQIGTCTRWYKRDGESCAELSAMFGTFSTADFISWNPSVGSSCSTIVDGAWYCVAIPGTPTTRTAPVQTTEFPTGTPTQTGLAQGCTHLWQVGTGDTCASIANANGISESQFLQWNPAVGATTCDNLVEDFYVCVAVGVMTTPPGSATSTSHSTVASTPVSSSHVVSSTTTSSAAGGGPVTTPTPTQSGMATGCRRFYLAQSGDGCWAIANSAGIDLKYVYPPQVITLNGYT
ncbi:hypothetical protein B0H63DRAFT_385493 [Podospora didyma]|uniref:LysM domain-containing protein n=1 Tax=Podospora didyma TaxID=330526 RepID=A0AAE0P872_9PEZI|nr:hypothetical protein B0H63DRAFT_385493 [Podospora didyma]